jgi:hypothetical protein
MEDGSVTNAKTMASVMFFIVSRAMLTIVATRATQSTMIGLTFRKYR